MLWCRSKLYIIFPFRVIRRKEPFPLPGSPDSKQYAFLNGNLIEAGDTGIEEKQCII